MPWTVTGNHRITLPAESWEPGETIPTDKLDPELARFLEETGHIKKTTTKKKEK